MEDKAKMERDESVGGDFPQEERVEALRAIISGSLNPEESRDVLGRLESSWRSEGEVSQDRLDSEKAKGNQ